MNTDSTVLSRTSSRSEAGASTGPSLRGRLSPRFLLIVALLVATALAYAPASAALAQLWSDTVDRGYVYGFLILLISLWLILRDSDQLSVAPVKPQPLALPALLVASVVWLIFWRAAVQDLYLLMLPVLALVALYAAFGWKISRIMALPVLFLIFGMPIWMNLAAPLQWLSARAVGVLIDAFGVPALMVGNIIRLPAGALEIAQGCSGINFLTVGVAMAVLYGELSRDPWLRRVLWVVLMGALALIGNWLRIFIVTVVAYDTHMQSSLVANHYWLGWIIFGIFFMGFLAAGEWITKRLKDPAKTDARASGIGTAPESGAMSPGVESTATESSNMASLATRSATPHSGAGTIAGRDLKAYVAALVVLVVLPVAVYIRGAVSPSPDPAVSIVWPATANGSWRISKGGVGTGSAFIGWHPVFANPTAISRRRYVAADGEHVKALVVAYRQQSQGAELVGYGNSLLGPVGEEIGGIRLQVDGVRIINGQSGPWRELRVVDRSGSPALIRVRYTIGQQNFAHPHRSELWYGLTALVGDPVSSMVAFKTACNPDCSAARERLDEVSRLLPAVSPQLTHAARRVTARK